MFKKKREVKNKKEEWNKGSKSWLDLGIVEEGLREREEREKCVSGCACA